MQTRPSISDLHASTVHARGVVSRIKYEAVLTKLDRAEKVINRQTAELMALKTERNNRSRQPRNMTEAMRRVEVAETDVKRLSDHLRDMQDVMRAFGWTADQDRVKWLRQTLSNIGDAFQAEPDAETA